MGSDPVADKSGFLCMYMSGHPDTLVSYVRYWGKVSEQVTSAKMTGIDTKGMALTYQTKGSTATKEIRVEFDPPLLGYDEVKPRLISMKSEAEEKLGMIPAPQVTSFRYNRYMPFTAGLIAFLLWSTSASSMATTAYAPIFAPATVMLSFFPSWCLTVTWVSVALIHVSESLYSLYLCKKHRTPFLVGVQYVTATLILGFPAWWAIKEEVQEARIASILKGQ